MAAPHANPMAFAQLVTKGLCRLKCVAIQQLRAVRKGKRYVRNLATFFSIAHLVIAFRAHAGS